MDIGRESKIKWPEKLIEALSIPFIILSVACFSGLAWLISGISPTYCVLFGIFLGTFGMWLFYTKGEKFLVLRIMIYGLILLALWCGLLEKLSIIHGKPTQDTYYWRDK